VRSPKGVYRSDTYANMSPPVLEYRLQTDGSILQGRGVFIITGLISGSLTHVTHGPIKILLLMGHNWMPLISRLQRSDALYNAMSLAYCST
jgi:hypothetical protein